MDYHPTRQYHSALIVRGLYYAGLDGLPADIRAAAIENGMARGAIEPPIMEQATLLGYRALGAEQWWIPQRPRRSLLALRRTLPVVARLAPRIDHVRR